MQILIIQIKTIVIGEKSIVCDADLVIEAAIEDMELKKSTILELDFMVKEGSIFATNTSSLSITEIGQNLNTIIK